VNRLYGGVDTDLTTIQKATAEATDEEDRGSRVCRIVFFSLDLPLSAVGDTLMLPITFPVSLWQFLYKYPT
jgi:uncharacterized protein YceK